MILCVVPFLDTVRGTVNVTLLQHPHSSSCSLRGSSPVCHHANRVCCCRCSCFSNCGSLHPGLDEPGRQAVALMVRRSQTGNFHPLGRVFCARLWQRVVLVALAGPAAPGPEICELHVPELPTRLHLPRVCSSVSRTVLQSG